MTRGTPELGEPSSSAFNEVSTCARSALALASRKTLEGLSATSEGGLGVEPGEVSSSRRRYDSFKVRAQRLDLGALEPFQ